MKVLCPNCGAAGRIADWRAPERRAYVRCPRCQARLFVGANLRCGYDRRSGTDRRKTYSLDYFPNGGVERRRLTKRRLQVERRSGWVRVSEWSSALAADSRTY